MNWIIDRYQLSNDFDVLLVLVLFSITGSSSLKVARPLLEIIGVSKDVVSPFVFWPVRIFVVFIMYQILFVGFGFFIGLISKPIWKFAWSFEQKMLSRFGVKFKD